MAWRTFGTTALLVCAVCGLAVLAGCPGEPPRAQAILRPLDKPQAVAIVAKAFRSLNIEPEGGRVIHVGNDQKELKLDVAAKGKGWGVAYVTNQDGDRLGEVLPARRDPDALIVVRGSGEGEGDTRAVLLFAGDYLQDDMNEEEHASTSIAAENKLSLAARDIVRRAISEDWK